MSDEIIRKGGCLCGSLRYQLEGEPFKTGICHCADCRKVTGTSFLAYGDWRPDRVRISGAFETFSGRSFCPTCGSRVFSRNEEQVEIYLCTLDEAPNAVLPQAEGWIIRREPWLTALPGVAQFARDTN